MYNSNQYIFDKSCIAIRGKQLPRHWRTMSNIYLSILEKSNVEKVKNREIMFIFREGPSWMIKNN